MSSSPGLSSAFLSKASWLSCTFRLRFSAADGEVDQCLVDRRTAIRPAEVIDSAAHRGEIDRRKPCPGNAVVAAAKGTDLPGCGAIHNLNTIKQTPYFCETTGFLYVIEQKKMTIFISCLATCP
jgi:hypothetical protein